MKTLAIRRLRIVAVPKGDGLSTKHKLTALSELAKMGVRVVNPEALDKASDAFFLDYHDVVKTLKQLRGGDAEYVPLFANFPDAVPDDDAYFARRIVGYLGNAIGVFDEGTTLENGVVVPEWLFDLSQFGADPITQFQSTSLWQRAKRLLDKRRADGHTEWLDVELVWADEVTERLRGWLESCLYAKSSIKEALHADIEQLLSFFGAAGFELDRMVMKENQALFTRVLWQGGQEAAVAALLKTPTDVLRLFAALTETDVSLAGPVKFPKLSRSQRREVLSALEASTSLAEDLKRYRGLWLEIGRYLHPGEYRKKFPRVAAAFDALRNGRITTFNSRTEALLRAGDATRALAHLSRRPGVLARKLHELLRRFPDDPSVVEAFATVASGVTVKNLLVLKSYFGSIDDADVRTIITKKGNFKVLPNNAKHAVPVERLVAVEAAIDRALLASVGKRDRWEGKTVWIDPRLATYTVPLAQRAASDGLLTVGRGSRIPFDLDKVLRLFVYWKQSARRTDLDLSVIQFDGDFKYVGHVSYTNLSSSGIAHSGDLQSAPLGAAEFIDITLTRVSSKVRYLATQVYRYAGEAFAEMQCHAGWMVRSNVDVSAKTFDIRTVANKFDLTGRASYCVPLVVDLQRKEIIVTDLYMGSKEFHNNVEGSHGNVALASREIARFAETRPNMKMLAEVHREARGGRGVETPDADVTFGLEDCTYDARNVEQVLAQLL